jgi:hypothetical protein
VWSVARAVWWPKAALGLLCLGFVAASCGGRSAREDERQASPRATSGQGGQAGSAGAYGGGGAGMLGMAATPGFGGGGAEMGAGQAGRAWDLEQGSAEVRKACTDYCAQMPTSCLASGELCRQGCILSGNATVSCVEDFAASIDCVRRRLDPAAACDDEQCSGTSGCLAEAREACRTEEAQVFTCQAACPPETSKQLDSCTLSRKCDPLVVRCVAGEESWNCTCSEEQGTRPVSVDFDTFTPCEDAALRCRGF